MTMLNKSQNSVADVQRYLNDLYGRVKVGGRTYLTDGGLKTLKLPLLAPPSGALKHAASGRARAVSTNRDRGALGVAGESFL